MSLASTSISAFEQRLVGSKAGGMALLLGCWAIVACSSFIATFGRLPDGLSNDDAMRLVGVRDLLAGQPWFDLVQHRLGLAGSPMHWSRLIDLPIALLLSVFRLFVDATLAERLTMAVWPLLVLLPALGGLRALARALHGEAAGALALVLGMFLAPVIGHFRPGALDHHNVQIVFLLWIAAWMIRFAQRDALLAGIAMAASLAIGLETLPAIAMLAASAGVRWVLAGERCQRECIVFGVSFAGALALLLLATVPPARWFVAACDALSVAHFSAGVVGGAGLALLAKAWSRETHTARLTGAVSLGVSVVAAVALLAPHCLANPYASVHPRLQEFWLANVAETQTVFWLLRTDPVEAIALFVPPAAALVLCSMIAIRTRGADVRWMIAVALQGVLLAVAMWELRGAGAANSVAVASLSASVVMLLPPRQGETVVFGQRPLALAVVFALTPLLLAGAGHSLARAVHWISGAPPSPVVSARTQCHEVSSYAPLAALADGRVLAFIDSGAFILAQSRHSVLAAPYHRNNDGNLAVVDALLASPAEAAVAVARHRIDYVAICPGAPEFRLYQRTPDGFAAQLVQGRVPAWLQPIALGDSPLLAWRVADGNRR